MKTTGERIRQAREELGWSAQTLAGKVGYKTQSGISNLENRATGSGGNKIGAIATALGVPIDWLINGPDRDVVPFTRQPGAESVMAAPNPGVKYLPQRDDPIKAELLDLFGQLDEQGKKEWLADLRGFVRGRRPHEVGNAPAVAGK